VDTDVKYCEYFGEGDDERPQGTERVARGLDQPHGDQGLDADPERFGGHVGNRRRLEIVEFLREENRVLREQLRRPAPALHRRPTPPTRGEPQSARAPRSGPAQRPVTPDTILRWYRELIANKYDGTARRRDGLPQAPPIGRRRGARGRGHGRPPCVGRFLVSC
jgi:hypothetical protein